MNQYVQQIKQLSNDSKYVVWYVSIVEGDLSRSITRDQAKKLLGYVELHHIVPKSFELGGTRDKLNHVYLTAREHFICHWLLTKMFSNNTNFREKMIHALGSMAYNNDKTQRRYLSKITSRVFERNKIKKSEIQGQPVIVDGIEYPNVSTAARSIGITVGSMNKRVRSPYFENFHFKHSEKVTERKIKKVIIDGNQFKNANIASKELGMKLDHVLTRLRSPYWPNYFYEGEHKEVVLSDKKQIQKEAVSRRVFIDGVTYSSMREASNTLGIKYVTLVKRVESTTGRYKDWVKL